MEDQIPQDEASEEANVPRPRGRHRIPESWSRVISINHDDLTVPRAYELATDLLLIQGVPAVPVDGRWKPWSPIFYSKFFLVDYDEIILKDFEITQL